MKEKNQQNETIPKKEYPITEAIELVKKSARANFDESIEVHFRLGINPKKGDQQIRGTVTLPHGTGKSKKVAVFAEEEKLEEARSAGADLTGGGELIEKIKKTEKCDFDVAIATPNIMKELAKIAKILGPRGLMPSPKNETVTTNIKKTIAELKKGKITFRNDDTANIHQIIGKVSFDKERLIENFKAFLNAIKKAKPASSKGIYLRNITLCSSMGRGIKVSL